MKVKTIERQLPMFETLFSDSLDPEHELLCAAQLIDWDGLHEALRRLKNRFPLSFYEFCQIFRKAEQ